jgi:predicted DNA-binding transcriptional regulator AlpA
MSEPLYPPRGMSRPEAARWVGVSASKFDQLVKDGRMPRPKTIDGRVIWDRYQLDAAIDELPDRDRTTDDDDWKVAV